MAIQQQEKHKNIRLKFQLKEFAKQKFFVYVEFQ